MKATPKKKPRKTERDPVAEMKKRLLKAGFTPERIKAETVAFREIQQKHPRMYALIRQTWDGTKLVEPYLLAVSAVEEDVAAIYNALPEGERRDAEVRYVHPAGMAFAYGIYNTVI